MREIILLKYGEVVLKGLNKSYFNSVLLADVKRKLAGLRGDFTYEYAQSTLCIRGTADAQFDEAVRRLRRVFGVAAICRGFECEKDMEAILTAVREKAAALLSGERRFKCVAKRSDKRFPYTSPQICALCGEAILEAIPDAVVDVNTPAVCVTIEIRDTAAFIHGGGEKGAGGMPCGSGGHALLLLSGGIDSPVAGYMAAKRGLRLDAVYFETPPYTGEAAKEKVVALAEILAQYTGRLYLHTVSLTEIQETLVRTCEERLFTLLLRRFMVRAAEATARKIGAGALVTGESLGQVASQTLAALTVTDAAAHMPVFRPCIGLDKDEIVARARKIGTFETSILPYEDCCTVFTPKHPDTRPTLEAIAAQEERLDAEALLARALAAAQYIKIEA